MLKAQKEAGGMNKGTAGSGRPSLGNRTVRAPKDNAPTLKELGVTPSMSSRAQAIASVPEDEFEQTIAEHRERLQAEA